MDHRLTNDVSFRTAMNHRFRLFYPKHITILKHVFRIQDSKPVIHWRANYTYVPEFVISEKNDKSYKLIRQNTLFFVPTYVFLSSLNGISTAIQYKFYTNINLFIIQCSLNTDVVTCNFCL